MKKNDLEMITRYSRCVCIVVPSSSGASTVMKLKKNPKCQHRKLISLLWRAAYALWDAQGGHNSTVAATSTQRRRSPAPSNGKRGNKRSGNACPPAAPKVTPLPAQIFIPFKTLAMTCVNFTIITPIGLTGVFHPVLGRKTSMPPNYFRFGGQSKTCHCHGNAFPRKCRIDFSQSN